MNGKVRAFSISSDGTALRNCRGAEYNDTKCLSAAGAKTLSARVVTLSGTIAEDCKTLLAEKSDTRWTIMNPDALKGHEGHQVTLKGRVEPGKTEIQVFKVRMKPEAPSAARLGDSAFRR